jgi:hypothetical protein
VHLTLNLKPRNASSRVDLPSDCTGIPSALRCRNSSQGCEMQGRLEPVALIRSSGSPGLQWRRSLEWQGSLQRLQPRLAGDCKGTQRISVCSRVSIMAGVCKGLKLTCTPRSAGELLDWCTGLLPWGPCLLNRLRPQWSNQLLLARHTSAATRYRL